MERSPALCVAFGIFIVVMQRSHERDLIGHILAKEFNGMHVCLPPEHERNHPYVFSKAKPGWEETVAPRSRSPGMTSGRRVIPSSSTVFPSLSSSGGLRR